MKSKVVSSLSAKDAQGIITATEEHLANLTVGHPAPGKKLVKNALKHARKNGTLRLVKPFAKLYSTLLDAFENKPGGVPSIANPHVILISGPEPHVAKTVPLELEIPAPVFAKAKRAAARYGRDINEILPAILRELTESVSTNTDEAWLYTGTYPNKAAAQHAVNAHLGERGHLGQFKPFEPLAVDYLHRGKVVTGRFYGPRQLETKAAFLKLRKRWRRALKSGDAKAAKIIRKQMSILMGCPVLEPTRKKAA